VFNLQTSKQSNRGTCENQEKKEKEKEKEKFVTAEQPSGTRTISFNLSC
jgi:hypothetical protein